jgi:hypothetical protein
MLLFFKMVLFLGIERPEINGWNNKDPQEFKVFVLCDRISVRNR